jgi:Tol biopolymer transport system component
MAIGLFIAGCDGKAPAGPSSTPAPATGPGAVAIVRGPIAFASDRDDRSMRSSIYLANEDATRITRLTPGRTPAWSPDGRQLAFDLAESVHVINVDGTGLRRIGPGRAPSWSPDGRYLVVEDPIAPAINILDVNGPDHRLLYRHDDGPYAPDWSPDGRLIVFGMGSGYGNFDPRITDLWTVSPDGSNLRQLGRDLGDAQSPAWSPAGDSIAFSAWKGIGVVLADGTGRRLHASTRGHSVAWTPDGRLVYVRSRDGEVGLVGPNRLYVNDGTVEQRLIPEVTAPVNPGYGDYSVAWRR